jgi:hypothetical protein
MVLASLLLLSLLLVLLPSLTVVRLADHQVMDVDA